MSRTLIALVFGVIALGAALVAFRRPRTRSGKVSKVPPALRPAAIDTILESDRLTKVTFAGMGLAIFFALFLPAYWFREPARMAAKEKSFAEESVKRGGTYFALTTDPTTGAPNLKGKECARCHGINAQGGSTLFLNPATNTSSDYPVPDLITVFSRYQQPPAGFKDARAFVKETIERGRPGTPMPTWGNKYGGPLTDQEIEDILNWIQSIQRQPSVQAGATGDQLFAKLCVACHGAGGVGGSGPSMKGGSESRQFPKIEDHIAFVKAGSKAGQPYGTSGKGTGRMPAWGGTLNDEQIKAVVEYERSL